MLSIHTKNQFRGNSSLSYVCLSQLDPSVITLESRSRTLLFMFRWWISCIFHLCENPKMTSHWKGCYPCLRLRTTHSMCQSDQVKWVNEVRLPSISSFSISSFQETKDIGTWNIPTDIVFTNCCFISIWFFSKFTLPDVGRTNKIQLLPYMLSSYWTKYSCNLHVCAYHRWSASGNLLRRRSAFYYPFLFLEFVISMYRIYQLPLVADSSDIIFTIMLLLLITLTICSIRLLV